MIQLDNVKFGYAKGNLLFNDVTWHLEQGHIYGLLGCNGAGKTTLLKIATGQLFPQEGTALIGGEPAYKRTAKQLSDVYFLQEEIYVPHLKIKQFEAAFAPFYPKFSHEQFMKYLTEFEMDNMLGFIDKFSHGQKKKVMIAFALATNVSLLIMDEPTNGLDIPSKSIFRKIMISNTGEKKTSIISTHQVRDLQSLIDAVSILDNGRMILSDHKDVITNKLFFGNEVTSNKSDETVFYTEMTPSGTKLVKENVEQKVSDIDLELLFNAAVQHKKDFTEMFK
jgi:ABC-2 type transport system ATP-binding protein